MEHSVKSDEKKRNKPNPISRIFICWMWPVLYSGNKRDLDEADLVVPTKQYDSEKLGDKLEKYWLAEVEEANAKGREPSLWRAVRRGFWLQFMPGAIYVAAICTARTVQPLIFSRLLLYWTVDSNMSTLDAAYYVLAMLGLNFLIMMCQHHNSLFVARFSLKLKVAASALLYRKLLRMSQVSMGEVAAGKLVNLLSGDVSRFDYSFMFLHYLWATPLQAAVVLYFLYQAAGYAPFVGLFSVVLVIFPVQGVLTKLSARFRRETAQRTDRRIKLMSEIINGIQVIKMYAWEKPFQKVVQFTREFELNALKKSLFVRSVFLGFMVFTERTILFVTCLTLVLGGTVVTATTMYPVQQYFSIIQSNLTLILPIAIASLSEMFVSFERIQSFLLLAEREDLMLTNGVTNKLTFKKSKEAASQTKGDVIVKNYYHENLRTSISSGKAAPHRQSVNLEYAVSLSGVSASWTNSTESSEMTLRNISMRIRKGKLCAIIGPVGAGKSSLLQVLLKELPVSSGSFHLNGRVSYASQEPWLFPATVRDNILFGLPYDINKYREVCRVCSLATDFKQFPYGDLSLVGERGVTLSGGQRARINLARAIYRDADIYLLDDPLSAVDANVGRQLFEGCISGYLRGKTVFLVTHQIHLLREADVIAVINEGSIENMGTYDELVTSGNEFSKLLSSLQESKENENGDQKTDNRNIQRGISVKDKPEDELKQVQAAEERAKGSLDWDVVYSYLSSVRSWCIVCTVALALLVSQASGTAADYWLSYWTNQVNAYQEANNGDLPDNTLDTQVGNLTTAQYLGIYGGLILFVICFLFVRISVFVKMVMRASKNIHNYIFTNLVAATMRFFDTNPSGRVLNRFSKDLGAMDEFMPRSLLECIQMYLTMASILTLNALALPWTLIPTFVLLVLFVVLLKLYLNAAQAVKRLEGTTKSPVFGMINSTIAGISTIRSSNSQGRLLATFDQAQDLHSSAFFTYIGGSAAFGMYLDSLCVVYLASIMTLFLLVDFGDVIPVGSIGLAVSQSIVLSFMLQMAARFTADFLAQATSVERVLEYTKLPSEPNLDDGPTKPDPKWPTEGNIKFENVFLKYGLDDPYVLKNLNFEFQGGRKVGVVGRTGAGKSSLISALFQLTQTDGCITIDGINTSGIARQELRSKISIIPQEPVLFSATLRYNLDPFDSYSDDDIWRALEQVELKEAIPALDFKVSESGSNFSVGQRQLVCLARAILRANKILVMDEATANVDPQTDALIQKTIRREFASCTVITIAHRLNTIMDSDRVLVMDHGEAVEMDHPYQLLLNPDSKFSFMVRETGDSMTKLLFETAKTKYFADHPERK